jgi:hypothetical protein
MWQWIAGGLAAVLAVLAVIYVRHRRYRKGVYRTLAARRAETITREQPKFQFGDGKPLHPTFEELRITRIGEAVSPDWLNELRQECLSNLSHVERSFIPGHKQGGTLSYESIHKISPKCLSTYHSEQLRRYLSEVIGEEVYPTADHDQSSCSLLYYTEAGDHIGWHFDHNFYKGRHFTVLISILNEGKEGGVSASKLQRQWPDRDEEFDTSSNSLIIFEGAKVRHRATQLGDGDRRILLSMTFATDPRTEGVKDFIRRVKDTAYYGLRAIWD